MVSNILDIIGVSRIIDTCAGEGCAVGGRGRVTVPGRRVDCPADASTTEPTTLVSSNC